MLRPGFFRVFDLVSVSFEFRFCACVLSWVEILSNKSFRLDPVCVSCAPDPCGVSKSILPP